MRNKLLLVVLLLLCPVIVAQQALNNDAVIKLVKAGLSDDLIVSTINASPGTYDTSANGLIALKAAGVSDKVVGAVVLKNNAPEAAAQGSHKVQEPEFNGIVFYLDPSGALVPLERQNATADVKMKAMGWGGMRSSNTYNGPKSPVRFKEGQNIRFVVRNPYLPGSGIEPRPDRLVTLDVLKTSTNKRELGVMNTPGVGAAFGQKGKIEQETLRPLSFSRYGEQSYQISPEKPLEPGEYLIRYGLSESFLFGIDPK
jgi:hypothetical protein